MHWMLSNSTVILRMCQLHLTLSDYTVILRSRMHQMLSEYTVISRSRMHQMHWLSNYTVIWDRGWIKCSVAIQWYWDQEGIDHIECSATIQWYWEDIDCIKCLATIQWYRECIERFKCSATIQCEIEISCIKCINSVTLQWYWDHECIECSTTIPWYQVSRMHQMLTNNMQGYQ